MKYFECSFKGDSICQRYLLLAILASFVLVLSCHPSERQAGSKLAATENKVSIRLGTIAGPETDVMEVVKQVAKRKYDLEIEIVSFSDFMTPNIALDDGSIDANAYQHRPFLEYAIGNRGFDLTAIGKTFLYPIAAYSRKITNKEQIGVGAKIAIPNDPSNEGRALLLLQAYGFLKLDAKSGLNATPANISENPLQLQFIELDAAQLPRVLDDVTLAIVNTAFTQSAELNTHSHILLTERRDSPYANLIVTKSSDADQEWGKKLLAAIEDEDVLQAAKNSFGSQVIPAWEAKSLPLVLD